MEEIQSDMHKTNTSKTKGDNIFTSMYYNFRNLDFFTKSMIVTFLVLIIVTPILISNRQILQQLAAGESTVNFVNNQNTVITQTTSPTVRVQINSAWPISFNNLMEDKQFVKKAIAQTTGLIGRWNFDEQNPWVNNCSTFSVLDSSGQGNNGQSCVANAGPTGAVIGQQGLARTFSGSNSYVKIPSSSVLNFRKGNNFSYSIWVKRSGSTNSSFLISKGAGSTKDPGYALILSSGTIPQLTLSKSNENARLTIQGSPITDTNWHHIVGTFNRKGNGILYVDGKKVAEKSISTYNVNLSNSYPVTIGCYSTGGECFSGTVDDVRIYNKVLSQTEVSALYGSQSEPTPTIGTSTPTPTVVATDSLNIYTNSLQGFSDWSWNGTRNFSNSTLPSPAGGNNITFTTTSRNGGLNLHANTAIPSNHSYTNLHFYARSSASSTWNVVVYDPGNRPVSISVPSDTWKEFNIPLNSSNLSAIGRVISGVAFNTDSVPTGTTLYVDDISLTGSGVSNPTNTPAVSPTPTRIPSPTPTATPIVEKISSITLAEDPNFTQNVKTLNAPFNSNPIYTDYTFSNSTPGTKLLYTRLTSSTGGVQTLTSSIQLNAIPTPTVAITPTSVVQPTNTPIPTSAQGCTTTVAPSGLQTAINGASSGSTICVTSGDLASRVTVSKTLTIRGAATNSTITQKFNGMMFVVSANGVTIQGLTLNGQGMTGDNGSCGSGPGGIQVNNYSNVSILNNTMNNFNCAVFMYDASNFKVNNNVITNVLYVGIGTGAGYDGTIDGNRVININPNGVSEENAYGIVASISNQPSRNVTISNNYVENAFTWECYDTHDGQNIIFRGNTCRGFRTVGINAVKSASWQPIVTMENNIVDGNTPSGQNYVGVNTPNAGWGAITITGGGLIQNNTIKNMPGCGGTRNGVLTYSTTTATVQNNTCTTK